MKYKSYRFNRLGEVEEWEFEADSRLEALEMVLDEENIVVRQMSKVKFKNQNNEQNRTNSERDQDSRGILSS